MRGDVRITDGGEKSDIEIVHHPDGASDGAPEEIRRSIGGTGLTNEGVIPASLTGGSGRNPAGYDTLDADGTYAI